MQKRRKNILILLIGSASILFAVRYIFFLKDGTSDTVETILIWTVFALSFLSLIFLLYPSSITPKNLIKKYQDKFYIGITIFILEISFFIENELLFTPIYIFSLVLIIFIVLLLSLVIPLKASRIFDICLIIFYSIYILAQDFYYRIFGDFFSFKEASTISEGIEFAEGTYAFRILHLYIIVITSIFLFFYIRYKNTSHINLNKESLKKIYMFPLIIFLLVNINAQYPAKSARLYLSDHYLYVSEFSKELFASKFGTMNLLIRDITATLTPSFTTKKDIEFIEEYYENNQKLHIENEYTSVFEGKNLIFIVGESFDSIAVSEELTPNIYKLKTEGIDFQNHFVPVYPRTTCDTEIIYNTSIIPSINDGPTCYVYNDNTYNHSLAEMFNLSGYSSNAFHSNDKEFYTRYLVYEGFKYDNFYGQNELGLSDTEKRFDSIFMTKSMDLVTSESEKFFSFMITLSGHSPYLMTNLAVEKHFDAVDAHYGSSVPINIKYYISTQIETDLMIGMLFEELEERGIIDDTVIMLTADHYPYVLDADEYMAYKDIDEYFMKEQGPLYIWASDIPHEEVTKLTSSFDILPTIVNMFGLDGNYVDYVGNDIFSDNYEPLVYFKNYAIYDGVHYQKLSSELELISPNLIELARDYYELSRKLLKVDYFNK